MGGPRTTFQDPETGRWTRVCRSCKETKDLENDFYPSKRDEDGNVVVWAYDCGSCSVERKAERSKRMRADPVLGPLLRAQEWGYVKRWRERNKARYLRAHAAAKRRMWANARRRARTLENQRIAYRLKREREGKPVTGLHSTAAMASDHLPKLPAQPLGDLLYDVASQNGGIKGLCDELGLNERTAQRWHHGQASTVQFDQADKVLTALSLMWFEVWPEDRYPEVHRRMEA